MDDERTVEGDDDRVPEREEEEEQLQRCGGTVEERELGVRWGRTPLRTRFNKEDEGEEEEDFPTSVLKLFSKGVS